MTEKYFGNPYDFNIVENFMETIIKNQTLIFTEKCYRISPFQVAKKLKIELLEFLQEWRYDPDYKFDYYKFNQHQEEKEEEEENDI